MMLGPRWARERTAPFLLLLALFGTFLSSPASAHDPSGYYVDSVWPTGTNEPFFLGSGVPTVDRVRASIAQGAVAWNERPPTVNFADNGYVSSQSPYGIGNCDAVGRSWVFQRDIGGSLAHAWTCRDSAGLLKAAFVIEFDDRPGGGNWHSDTTSALPTAGNYDRWSVASHEMGHAMGHYWHWDEFGASTRCEEGLATKLTMCRTVAPATIMQRSLDDHDWHTYDSAYS
jgi:hypothetical protein